MKLPLVSVSLICYNQEKFIAQSIESVINQKTNFDFEILIGDDGSTDKTKEIIKEYAEKDERIVFINRIQNIGLQKNVIDIINRCRGKYIALLEGDDYWIDKDKLQIQFDFLEEHKNCSVCFTDCVIFKNNDFEDGIQRFANGKNKQSPLPFFDLDHYLSNAITIANNTKMFRKDSQPKKLPDLFFESIQWDWILHLLHGLTGDFGYINKTTLAYRRHENAILEKHIERVFLDAINVVYNINPILPDKYWKYFKHPLYEMNSLSFFYLKNKEFMKFIKWYIKWIKYVPFRLIKFRDEFYKIRVNLINRR